MSDPLITPWDDHNRRLVANVHPPDWHNPQPADRYNLVVIGAGTAGLVTAAAAAALGARVALIEKHLMGGDCLNVGCVPSKSMLRAAKAAHEARRASTFGIHAGEVRVDFPAVMQRVRAVRADISPHDSARRFGELGVDVFLGPASFSSRETVDVNGAKLRFRSAVICTGARPAIPDIPGLVTAGFLTNESVFNISSLPARLAVIGGGAIGCELAQAFQRLGSQVTLVHNKARLLDREDDDAAMLLAQVFAREGIRILSPARITRVSLSAEGKTLQYESNGGTASVVVDEILVAAGRTPNVESLNLAVAGVGFDARQGVRVDDHLRTTNRRIFAAGDVCLHWKFTHAADFTARIAVQNALFLGRKRLSALNMSWCTYTDPEIAHVGLSEREAEKRGVPCQSFLQPFSGVDRAITDGVTEGYVKILVRRGTDKICGATIMAPRAGDLIAEIAVAMKARLGLGELANVIHPYPTLAEAIRKCGDAWNRTRLTPTVKSLLARWLAWHR